MKSRLVAVLISICICAQASTTAFASEAQPGVQEEQYITQEVTAEGSPAEESTDEEQDTTDDGGGQDNVETHTEEARPEDTDIADDVEHAGDTAGSDNTAGNVAEDAAESSAEDAAEHEEEQASPQAEEQDADGSGTADAAQEQEAPVIEEDADENAVSEEAKNAVQMGKCGENVKWTLKEEEGQTVLCITGSGDMYDYDKSPFAEYRDDVVKISISDNVTKIGKNAFYGMTNVKQVLFGVSVRSIGSRAFMKCESLGNIAIQYTSKIRTIGPEAFRGCTSLKTVDGGRNIEEIGGFAFLGCSDLTTVILSPSVKKIGQKAFYSCPSLEEISIPASVTEIGADAITKGEHTKITYAGTKQEWVSKFGNTLPTVYKPGFYKDGKGRTHYGLANGTDVRGQIYRVKGKYYAFDKNGCTVCSQWYTAKNGDIYYTGKNGAAVTGFKTVGGKKYYFTDSRYIGFKEEDTGVRRKNMCVIDGNRYYLGSDGIMRTGFKTIDGRKYYFMDSRCSAYDAAKAGMMMTGWRTIDGKKYYFGSDGVMRTGWQTISGKKYHLSKTGEADTGWKTINGMKYHFTGTGAMDTGWKTISKKKYYFGSDGVTRTGWQTIDGKKYHFSKTGEADTGWKTFGGRWYHFTSSGVMNTGWYTDWNGKTYYFHEDGHKQGAGRVRIDGKMCAFDKGGACTSKNSSINDVVRFAKSWVGKIPYKSSVTKNDPNNERSMELKEGRGSDCSWFVFHCLEKYGYLTKFVHSYEWGSKPSCYRNGKSIGRDISKAKPGDIICYDLRRSPGIERTGENSHVAIYIGNGQHVECADGFGTVIDKVMTKKIIDIVRFSD